MTLIFMVYVNRADKQMQAIARTILFCDAL